jgi:hypothetical protein
VSEARLSTLGRARLGVLRETAERIIRMSLRTGAPKNDWRGIVLGGSITRAGLSQRALGARVGCCSMSLMALPAPTSVSQVKGLTDG